MSLVLPNGRKPSTNCPRCRAPEKERVASAGFGAPTQVCGRCGHDFGIPAADEHFEEKE